MIKTSKCICFFKHNNNEISKIYYVVVLSDRTRNIITLIKFEAKTCHWRMYPQRKINEPNRKLKSSIKLKNTKAPFPIVADMFAQKRLCRITVKVIKNLYTDIETARCDTYFFFFCNNFNYISDLCIYT